MQLHHLVTVLGLAFSQAQAAIPMVANHDQVIRQIVTLITDPTHVMEAVPGLKELVPEAKLSPTLSHAQLNQGYREIFTSLRDVDNQHAPLIIDSLAGYHHTQDPARAEIYRNSLYSRIRDLSEHHPAQIRPHLDLAHHRLLTTLNLQLQNLEESHLPLIGSDKAVQELKEFVARFKNRNEKEIKQLYHEFLSTIPPTPKSEMVYLSPEQVNKALMETNSASKTPALPVDGNLWISTITHHHHHQTAPVAQTSPSLAAHAPQPVAASA